LLERGDGGLGASCPPYGSPEQAPRTSADPEAFEALWVFLDHLDSIDASHFGPLRTEIDHLVHGVRGALEDGFDAPICEVAHPAADTRANRVLCGRRPEPDVLHEPGDEHPAAAVARRIRGTQSLPSGA
jgi:hypothetical protein